MKHWLLKTEPDVYSIDDLRKEKRTVWDKIRNYQARNYLKEMSIGDRCLFYRSSIVPPGVAGLAEISKAAFPEIEQFKAGSEYFDPKATKEAPRWFSPELKFIEKFEEILPLEKLRDYADLKGMVLLQRGSRLSVQPVQPKEFSIILKLAQSSEK